MSRSWLPWTRNRPAATGGGPAWLTATQFSSGTSSSVSARPLPGNAPLVEALCEHASAVFGEPIDASGTPLYTDARLFCERGIPAVLYGCGPRTVLESNAKRADEHIELDDLRRATKVVARALADLLS